MFSVANRKRLLNRSACGAAVLTVMTVGALTGCGGGDDDSPGASTPPTPAGTTTTAAADPGAPIVSAITPAVSGLDLQEPGGLKVEATKSGDRFNVVVRHDLGKLNPPNGARVRAKADAVKILRAIYTGAQKDAVGRVVVRSSTVEKSGNEKTAYTILMVGSTGRSIDWKSTPARIERSWDVPVDRL